MHLNREILHELFGNDLFQVSHMDLSNKGITSIDILTFRDLCSLRHLLLNDNKLEKLNIEAFKDLKGLETLTLYNNPIDIINITPLFQLFYQKLKLNQCKIQIYN
jgi:Leucine-rich repeat (LRR) protein